MDSLLLGGTAIIVIAAAANTHQLHLHVLDRLLSIVKPADKRVLDTVNPFISLFTDGVEVNDSLLTLLLDLQHGSLFQLSDAVLNL